MVASWSKVVFSCELFIPVYRLKYGPKRQPSEAEQAMEEQRAKDIQWKTTKSYCIKRIAHEPSCQVSVHDLIYNENDGKLVRSVNVEMQGRYRADDEETVEGGPRFHAESTARSNETNTFKYTSHVLAVAFVLSMTALEAVFHCRKNPEYVRIKWRKQRFINVYSPREAITS